MRDLREKLAVRLWLVSLGDAVPKVLTHTPNHFVMEGWRRLANECIRQMGWARLQGGLAADGQLPGPDTLTPAPDDWTTA